MNGWMRRGWWWLAICWTISLSSNWTWAGESYTRLELTPSKIQLAGRRAATQVLVTAYDGSGRAVDVTRAAEFGKSTLVHMQDGYLRARKDGDEVITVQWGDLQSNLPVHVTETASPQPVSFRTEALAVLTKQGCNGGSCHGKPNGRGALELSLNAFDPRLDETNLIRGSFVRFTDTLMPDHSLLLKKPTLRVTHGGGKKLRQSDEAYTLLRQWIAEGCLSDRESAPRCVGVTVEPAERVVHLGSDWGQQQVRVVAQFADGTRRDVTRIASYSLSNQAVATVGRYGRVSGQQRGQTAVVVRYLDDIVSAHFTFVRKVPGFQWHQPAAANYVDRHVHHKLKQLQYQPAPQCDDATFLRRLSLDVRGLLPTAAEARAFLQDDDEAKRDRWIDRYLESPEYARFWGLKMADLLRVNSKVLSPEHAQAYSGWIQTTVQQNMPYDQFVTQLLTATGLTSEVMPANFFRVTRDTKMVTETVAQLFMGSRIMCAQCHNHPYESWTQDNYYQIGATFHELDRQVVGDDKKRLPAVGSDVEVRRSEKRPLTNPRTGIVQKPWPTDVSREASEDKRSAFAQWLTGADNPYFARVAVNRIWAELLGQGLVEPVDDFRSSNPAANEELLKALAAHFVASGYDRKSLMRTILRSHTYQRSAETNRFNRDDTLLNSHARVRLLSAEQLQDAIKRVCEGEQYEQLQEKSVGLATRLQAEAVTAEERQTVEKQLQATRAELAKFYMTQQHYPQLTTFLKAFGQPERQTACACERRAEVSLDQALQLMNSPLIRQQIAAARGRYAELQDDQLMDQLYLAAFSRLPTPQERATVQQHLAEILDRGQAVEDLVWALINTHEFIFQH